MLQKSSWALMPIALNSHEGVKTKNTLSFTGTVKSRACRSRLKMYKLGMFDEILGLIDELLFGVILEFMLGLRLLLIW